MKPEDKVPSLELCKKLFELGITKDIETERVWEKALPLEELKEIWFLGNRRLPNDKYAHQWESIPAPDLSELCELFPEPFHIHFNGYEKKFECHLTIQIHVGKVIADTACNATAEMLILMEE